jgi:hypothetical protein
MGELVLVVGVDTATYLRRRDSMAFDNTSMADEAPFLRGEEEREQEVAREASPDSTPAVKVPKRLTDVTPRHRRAYRFDAAARLQLWKCTRVSCGWEGAVPVPVYSPRKMQTCPRCGAEVRKSGKVEPVVRKKGGKR